MASRSRVGPETKRLRAVRQAAQATRPRGKIAIAPDTEELLPKKRELGDLGRSAIEFVEIRLCYWRHERGYRTGQLPSGLPFSLCQRAALKTPTPFGRTLSFP